MTVPNHNQWEEFSTSALQAPPVDFSILNLDSIIRHGCYLHKQLLQLKINRNTPLRLLLQLCDQYIAKKLTNQIICAIPGILWSREGKSSQNSKQSSCPLCVYMFSVSFSWREREREREWWRLSMTEPIINCVLWRMGGCVFSLASENQSCFAVIEKLTYHVPCWTFQRGIKPERGNRWENVGHWSILCSSLKTRGAMVFFIGFVLLSKQQRYSRSSQQEQIVLVLVHSRDAPSLSTWPDCQVWCA